MRTTSLAVFTVVGLLATQAPLWAAESTPPSFDLAAATAARAQVQAEAGQGATPGTTSVESTEPDAELDLTPQKPEDDKHITQTWWFWGAVAGVVVTTVAIVLIAGRPVEKPESDLGDMRAFDR